MITGGYGRLAGVYSFLHLPAQNTSIVACAETLSPTKRRCPATLEGSMWDKPRVLFLCTGHPERSEMAEGFLRALTKDAIQPVSAAVEPAPLDPLAVDAMKEVGIDISHQIAKDVRTALQESFAYVVELGDESKESYPVFPFALRRFQWSLEDPLTVQGPAEQRLEAFRRLRNQIAPKVRDLVDLAFKEQTEGLHWQH